MEVTLLLCDAAENVGGKLYILGGGWSQVTADAPFNMALAVLVAVPWDRTNHGIQVAAKLMTEDGEPVVIGEDPVGATGTFEIGRPPGTKPGTQFNAPLVLRFNGVALAAGGYRWEFDVDGTQMATAPFRAIQG